MKYFLIFTLVLLTGCSATWVAKNYEHKRGIVKFNSGSSSRRIDALEKMGNFCGGKYEIVKEEFSESFSGVYSTGAFSVPLSEKFSYLFFKCQ